MEFCQSVKNGRGALHEQKVENVDPDNRRVQKMKSVIIFITTAVTRVVTKLTHRHLSNRINANTASTALKKSSERGREHRSNNRLNFANDMTTRSPSRGSTYMAN